MGRDPESGKRKYTNKTIHATLRDAQSYLSRTQRDRDLGVFFEPSRMSFDGYLDLKVPLHQIPFIQRVPATAATEGNTLKLIPLLMSIRSD